MAGKPSFEMPVPRSLETGPLIKMRAITKLFKTTAGEIPVLKGIDADFYRGEFVSVVGRSGSGKSTLVNMLTGIDHPTSGTVEVGGVQIHKMSESRMSVWRGRNLGIVFQFFQLLPMLSLIENVMLPMDFCNIYPLAERPPRAMALLERVGLSELAHKLPGAISGGQQQSTAVARALATDAPILIADEPTGNLDSRTAESVIALFEELVGQGKTIIMVTHDSNLARRTTRSLVISDGELVPPDVVGAFGGVSPSRLLKISRLVRPLSLAPGAPLSVDPNQLYALVSGQLVVFKNGLLGLQSAKEAGRLESGAWFDLPAIQKQFGSGIALSAAAERPAELLVGVREQVLPLLPVKKP
jgi:putative ABC transport system ATP-binding protein